MHVPVHILTNTHTHVPIELSAFAIVDGDGDGGSHLFLYVWKLCLKICIIFTPQQEKASSEWISCSIWPLFFFIFFQWMPMPKSICKFVSILRYLLIMWYICRVVYLTLPAVQCAFICVCLRPSVVELFIFFNLMKHQQHQHAWLFLLFPYYFSLSVLVGFNEWLLTIARDSFNLYLLICWWRFCVYTFVGSSIANILSNCVDSTTAIFFLTSSSSLQIFVFFNLIRAWMKRLQQISTASHIRSREKSFWIGREFTESRFEEVLVNEMTFARVETQWIKKVNIYSINYTLNSVSKRIFFVFQWKWIAIAIHFYANHLNRAPCYQLVVCISISFFNHSDTHTKSNCVSAIFPWTFNHERTHTK